MLVSIRDLSREQTQSLVGKVDNFESILISCILRSKVSVKEESYPTPNHLLVNS